MEVYRCDLTLHDYLFFATTERGKVAETGPFIHNYALTYALGWALSPWHNEVQKPHYREELAQVGRRYVTPARVIRGSTIVSQYNTMSESYGLGKGRSIGYPDWGFVKCYRPGSIFRFYVVSAEVANFPRYLRLVKFMAKASLSITAGQVKLQEQALNEREMNRSQVEQLLLTWNDLPKIARPIIYDIIVNALPGRLIENALFNGVPGPYFVATFGENMVQLPTRMGYYGENLCTSW
jgi:CRISPR-associated protein Csc1